jgi:hypothetical protein
VVEVVLGGVSGASAEGGGLWGQGFGRIGIDLDELARGDAVLSLRPLFLLGLFEGTDVYFSQFLASSRAEVGLVCRGTVPVADGVQIAHLYYALLIYCNIFDAGKSLKESHIDTISFLTVYSPSA